ncbi:MAG: MucR family transcriptional regulator [Pseudomonadota bacterium]
MTAPKADHRDILDRTAEIVAAHVANNPVPRGDLPALIENVFTAISALGAPPPEPEVVLTPAVPIKKSVTDEYLICLEDGRQLKMLRRHLDTAYGMTPAEYRARWGLPGDYPMVAPAYARKRQALAKEIGLGRKPEDKPKPKAKRRRKVAS